MPQSDRKSLRSVQLFPATTATMIVAVMQPFAWRRWSHRSPFPADHVGQFVVVLW
jgi:hypothetical protein